ncbi:MAG: hypothetical protein AB1584_20005 [Pseudomonadota bacterium]
MDRCLILIVEDDKEAIDSWKRDIVDFNDEHEVKFDAQYASTRDDAIRALDRTRYNCAVVDLRLPSVAAESGEPSKEGGNSILEKIVIEAGIPAVVYSAHSSEASELVQRSNIQVRSKKGGASIEILEYLAGLVELMAAMDATRKKIAIESAKIFNDSIWRRWQTTWCSGINKEVVAGIITRQTASHVADRLSLPPMYHHPDEFYIVPPLHESRLDTGDLLTDKGDVFVVVTPRCNMANQPLPTHLMLARCKPMVAEWTKLQQDFAGNAEAKRKASARLRDFAIQNHATSTHFIPMCDGNGPWLVDFRDTRGVESAEIARLIESRFASIATHFVPNLVQRYAAYLGRIGQPDIDWQVLREQVCIPVQLDVDATMRQS